MFNHPFFKSVPTTCLLFFLCEWLSLFQNFTGKLIIASLFITTASRLISPAGAKNRIFAIVFTDWFISICGPISFSTLFRIIHRGGFGVDDFKGFVSAVYSNALQSLATVIKAMESLDIPFGTYEREVIASNMHTHNVAIHE